MLPGTRIVKGDYVDNDESDCHRDDNDSHDTDDDDDDMYDDDDDDDDARSTDVTERIRQTRRRRSRTR